MTDWLNRCHFGDCVETMRRMPGGIVQACVTSPPYFGLRDYGHAGQIGQEATPTAFVAKMVEVFREVRRVLRDDGTLWLNLGDSYGTGKQLLGIPWRVAFALQEDGWILRQDIIWSKPNPMPESATDRCSKAHEYIFLLSKSRNYRFDSDAIREAQSEASLKRYKYSFNKAEQNTDGSAGYLSTKRGTEKTEVKPNVQGRNRRTVWTVATKPYKGAHFATFPPALIEPCILAGAPPGGVVLDPFFGSGTTGQVAIQHARQFIGCELNPEYEPLQARRLQQPPLL